MRYAIERKTYPQGCNFYVKNDRSEELFFVDGTTFGLNKELSFQDMDRNELVLLRQKLLPSGSNYEIWRGSVTTALTTNSRFTSFLCKLTVNVLGPGAPLEVEGDFHYREYTFSRNDKTAAVVSTQWFVWKDTYGVEITDGEDDVLILAIAVLIDMICHGDQKNR